VPLTRIRFIPEVQIDALAAERIHARGYAGSWPIATAEICYANPREHFLHGAVIARDFVEQMIRVPARGGDMQQAAAD